MGITHDTKIRPLLQIETYKASGQPLVYSILPGLQFPLPNGTRYIASFEYRSASQRTLGLKFSLWRKF